MDVGLEKDILKRKATVILSATDVFNTRFRRWIAEAPGFYSESRFQWRSRQLLLSFTYRINQEKKRKRGGRGDGNGGDF